VFTDTRCVILLDYADTIGLLIGAKEKGLITSVTAIIEAIRQTGFRRSERLIAEMERKVANSRHRASSLFYPFRLLK